MCFVFAAAVVVVFTQDPAMIERKAVVTNVHRFPAFQARRWNDRRHVENVTMTTMLSWSDLVRHHQTSHKNECMDKITARTYAWF